MEHATNKLLFSLFLVSQIVIALSTNVERGSYIIHMDKAAIPAPFSTHHSWYTSTIASLSTEDGNAPVHLYTYKHVMNGFSAVLSKSHLDQLANIPGHIATYPETFGQLHTTHTPTFLGLNKHSGLWPAANYGDDMIIGIIDTGIWPESESFNDH
ncbi:Subtilisin-like protease SBT1.9, partial [Thalictrum thalictroides]